MKIIWLGQAGLYIETGGLKIMVDPYLSDSVEKQEPKNKRRVAVKESLFDLKPDVMIFTHDHLDHYDHETVKRFIFPSSNILVLAPMSVWQKVRKMGGNNYYVLFNRHTEWTQGDVRFSAVAAAHSDPFAIGVIIENDNRKIYITGDTLYSNDIFPDIPDNIEALFLPINGHGNNMNITDAKRFAEKINPKVTVPVHFGMFDDINGECLDCKNKIIPQIYKEMEI